MTTEAKDPVVVVVELNGGNDYLNTVVPYSDPNYHDNRVKLRLDEDEVHKIDGRLGFHPAMGPLKDVYDRGDMAIVHGVGYENPSRSHFRSMDIWHTCEPVKVGDEGWVGRASRQIDPKGEKPYRHGKHRPRPAQSPGRARRARGVGRRPLQLWAVHGRRAGTLSARGCWRGSRRCTRPAWEPDPSPTSWTTLASPERTP